ncbi:DUF1266 domain-containing protein [Salmonella enterica subsp. enterica serovar Worthington]|nr:DUF1266 domain-containing protein [Salmonella enterica subsp. enterica serovar Worthington]
MQRYATRLRISYAAGLRASAARRARFIIIWRPRAVRDALAFDCMRTAFLTRCIAGLGWCDVHQARLVLLLNAQRAQDCFDSGGLRHRLRSRPPGMAHAT